MRLPGNRKIIILVLIATALSLAVTFVIIISAMANRQNRQTATIADLERSYENVFITSCDNGEIRFISGGEEYIVQGQAEEKCTGVADIVTEKGRLKKIRIKEATIEGTVNSYTDEAVNIKEYGSVDCIKDFPVYNTAGKQVKQQNSKMLIVGNSQLKFVLENNKIAAAIIDFEPKVDKVRVIIKNADSIFFDNVIVKYDKKTFNARKYFKKNADKAEIEAKNGFIKIGKSNKSMIEQGYIGKIIVSKYDKGYLVINELPIEEYLRFVIPSEMLVSSEYEALKAQAVCARTFVYSQMKNDTYAKYGANIDDSTSFQVYNRIGSYDITDKAVFETAGEVIKYKGEYIYCYYFSTSDGRTRTLSVWGNDEKVGYIKSVKSEDKSSPFYRWKAKLILDNIKDHKYGMLKSIENGKVFTAHFEHGDRIIKTENEIRQFLGKALIEVKLSNGSTRKDLSALPSAYFKVESNKDGICYIEGGGFGHGIGMSQCGANDLAKKGKDYRQIISYYYKDITIEKNE